MSAKDEIAGTAKQLVAEIIGDGRLAEEGTRQAVSNDSRARPQDIGDPVALERTVAPEETSSVVADEQRFAALLGRAALKIWSNLPRDAQEMLFTASVDDSAIANSLAVFLHDRHPRTAHPPKPTQLA